MKVLITGGAGFIGSRLTDILSQHGHELVVVDNLSPQVHSEGEFAAALRQQAHCYQVDVRDSRALAELLPDVEVIVHLAAETGTGQSMYAIRHYSDVNVLGTATFLDLLLNQPNQVRRIVLAGSRAVYGEGQYLCPQDGVVYPPTRSLAQLDRHEWEPVCPRCAGPLSPVATTEEALLQPQSIYASNKQTQEQLVAITAQARGIEAVLLRYQNVFGPGQALTNPYTGVICAFFTRIIQNQPINLFEDGEISRDFVYIDDVAAATAAAVEATLPADHPQTIINVGTGQRTTIRQVALALREILGSVVPVETTGQYRVGDIRHCYADISRLAEQLGYQPQFSFEQGLERFVEWALTQREMVANLGDQLEKANQELRARKLFR